MRPTPTEQIKERFTIICDSCGGSDVCVEFYAGFIHDCGGDIGSLRIACNSCGIGVEVDDEY